MKNKKVIDSWNKISPDERTKDKMLKTILEHGAKQRGKNKSKQKRRRAFVPVAACLAILISGTIAYAAVRSGGILQLFQGNPQSDKNTDVVFKVDSKTMKVGMGEITGPVRGVGQIIKKQYEDYNPISSQSPSVYTQNFSSIKEAAEYIGYVGLNLPQLNLNDEGITVTTLGESDGSITSLYLEVNYKTDSSISVTSQAHIYTEFNNDDIGVGVTSYSDAFEGVDYSSKVESVNGREFYVVNSSPFENNWLGQMVFWQENKVIYNLFIRYQAADQAEVDRIMYEWMKGF